MEDTKVNNQKICPKCGKEYPKKTIYCDDCTATLMKKTTFERTVGNRISTSYVCPKCSTRVYPPIKNKICEKCKVELLSDIDYAKLQQSQEKKFSTIFTTVCIIIALLGLGYFISIFTSPSEPDIYTCARCNKTFTDSANTKSIAYSNFCEKCHDDVEFLKEVQDAME